MASINRKKMKLEFILLLTLSIKFIVAIGNGDPTAQTQQGIYVGRQTKVNDTTVNFWVGVPYAQHPVGNLRWKPPQPLPHESGIKPAFIPNACPQGNNFEPPFTEACLSLNVYAPEHLTNLPVFVWIHGGSFTGGAGLVYNPDLLIATSVAHSSPIVVVTINYRLGFLGFIADQGLYDERSGANNRSTTGNYGILDQMMALDWLKENIRGFGGNPEQITIGGESAGGISVTMLLTSPLMKDNVFQRAIIQSGGLWPNYASKLEDAINNSGNILRTAVSCSTVECLRNLSVKQILAVQNVVASKNIFGLAAPPVIDAYAIDDIMENNYARGHFKKVPVLVGTTRNETNPFTCGHFKNSATVAQVQAFLNTLYNATIISKIPDFYGSLSSADNPLTYLNIVYSDSWAHCASRRIASTFASSNLPSYLFTYNHALPIASACDSTAHGTDLVMLFPSILDGKYKLTVEEEELSKNMMLYWTNFIRTGNPNFQGSFANWEAYSIISDSDLALDLQPQLRNGFYNTTCSGFWDLYAVTNRTESIFF